MTNESILYLQTNNDVAVEVKRLFDDDECEFLITDSAAATFEMMLTREFSLVVVDSFIPDMRLIEFATKCNNEYPSVLLNVCTDLRDISLVTQLMGLKNIKKIFLPPWELEEIEDGIRSTLDDVQIQRNLDERTDDLQERRDDFNRKMEELTRSMKTQQYSYYKLSAVLNPIRDAFVRISNAEILSEEDLFEEGDNISKEKKDRDRFVNFINQACEKFLRLQTTGKADTEHIENQMREDFEKALKNAPDISIKDTDLVIVKDISRSNLSGLWFALWLIVRLQMIMCKKGTVSVSSRYLTSSRLKVTVDVEGTFSTSTKVQKYLDFTENVLKVLAQQSDVKQTENSMVYDMYFVL